MISTLVWFAIDSPREMRYIPAAPQGVTGKIFEK
jgi:hypothetical protein